MNTTLRTALALVLVPLAALGLAATKSQTRAEQGGTRSPAAAPARAAVRTSPVRGLVAARPFALAEPYVSDWRLERPTVRSGWLLVLEVDPRFVQPHQVAMPVLLLGGEVVECVNFGFDSGRVIVIVPSRVDERGEPLLDLAASPAWFGAPELPERVDAAWIAAERTLARPEDVATFTATEVAAARAKAGAPLQAADRVELDRQAAFLILEHSPQERALADTLLVPVMK
jgi:hypothetical protein